MRLVSGFAAAKKLLERRVNPAAGSAGVEAAVKAVIDEVVRGGDAALKRLTAKYDNADLKAIEVLAAEIAEARNTIASDLLSALEAAAGRIRAYHEEQRDAVAAAIIAMRGKQLLRPLERVGVYAPGGKAWYPSTVLMTAIPARVAGVDEVILATPPGPDGKIPAPTLAAASIAGVDRVFSIGGAQAIAAMAYGTESVPRVDKICGPGNVYVMTAKRLVYGAAAIDGLQGPSEVLIIADATANPEYCAADMLAQAEHDAMAQSVLVTTSQALARQVLGLIKDKLAGLERREIIEKSLEERGVIAIVDTLDEAVELANLYAPEHLCFLSSDAREYLPKIRHAGCVFIGERATVAVGDYVAGPSHALPTGGTARFSSPLNILDFVKIIDVVDVDDDMLKNFGPVAVSIARAEGLESHAQAVEVRMKADA